MSKNSGLFLEDDTDHLRRSAKKSEPQISETQALQNQIASLNQVINTLESSLFNKAGKQLDGEPSLSTLCERWRQKVFDTLVTQKRYELINQQNLQTFSRNSKKLKQTITDLSTQNELLTTKNKELQNQALYLTQSNQALQTAANQYQGKGVKQDK